jgi:hypothetical protein
MTFKANTSCPAQNEDNSGIFYSLQYLIEEAHRSGNQALCHVLKLSMTLAEKASEYEKPIFIKKANDDDLLLQAKFILEFLNQSKASQKKILKDIESLYEVSG